MHGISFLGAAGLLKGYRAASHWAWRDLLPLFGAIPSDERVVIDHNRITGGGVTAGIDFAFSVVAQLRGRDEAEALQLALEYDPQPLGGGTPDTARPEILAAVQAALTARGLPTHRARVEAIAAAQP